MNKHTKIGVLGAGVEGLAAVSYFLDNGFTDVVLFDEKNVINNEELIINNRLRAGLRVVTGKDAFGKFLEGEFAREVLFRSPGIHVDRLEEARKAGIKVTSTTQYFFENCPGRIIGVTGTKGKGTTSTLIYLMLKEAGMDVYLGGNIGESPLDFLHRMGKKSWVVLELSSFQLQDLTISPQIAVVLRVTSDHMDYHKDHEEYVEAKSAIVRYQKADDVCVVNVDYDYTERYLPLSAGLKYFVSRRGHVENGAFISDAGKVKTGEESLKILFCLGGGDCVEVGDADKVGLLGAHNLENILPAVCVGQIVGAPTAVIQKVIYGFKGLPNRLEFVREVKGVKYFNDSFSTTPETSISATYAFKGPVILIAGGSEKFSDYTEWGVELSKNPDLKAVVLHGVTAERMEKAIKNFELIINNGPPAGGSFASQNNNKKERDTEWAKHRAEFPLKVYRAAGLKDALKTASEIAVKGDNVVMSPAAASFDQFKNYKERGQKFREWVGKLV